MTPPVRGLLESSLYVDEMDRAARFYARVFGFQIIFSNERLTALSILDRQVLLLFRKGASARLPVSAHDGSGQAHLAFAIAANELPAWEQHLELLGIPIEERKLWDRGGTSLYFRDPENHLLEVVTPGVWSIY